ncbi:MAG: hypothetical protein ACI9K3_001352 [Halovenus sp.]|jgi:hypothetical protein
MFHRSAEWLANRDRLPDSARAVVGYYGDTGVFDYRSLLLKRRVDSVVEGMLDRLFAEVGRVVADELGYDEVVLRYDTKLVLPAKLTLGRLYRELEPADHLRAEEMTRLAVEALIDGDMRDAINDEEFEDFEFDVDLDERERRRAAELAQEHMQHRVEKQLAAYSSSVRETYEWAVERSNAHQARDERFRELMAEVQRGETPPERLATEYRDAAFDDPPALFTEAELSVPYIKTQYDRVGVLYDAMLGMYRESGLPVDRSFQRAIVLAIIGAQIWLDDIDDFEDDLRSGQLTPVTAEYLLAGEGDDPRGGVVSVGRQYLDRAQAEATAAGSPLTGIAIEYILRSGDPDALPPGIEIRHRGGGDGPVAAETDHSPETVGSATDRAPETDDGLSAEGEL